MSEYLKQKMLRKLHEARDSFEVDCENMIGEVVKEGVDHMKSGIHEVETKSIMPEAPERPEIEPRYSGTDLAEIAVDVYKGLKKVDDEDTTKGTYVARKQPSTAASRYNARALARALTGMRNSGNEGKQSLPAGPHGGNTGGNTSNYYSLTTSMSLEQYEQHIKDQWGLTEEVEEETEQELLTEKTPSPVKELEKELVKLEDTSWQSIDRVMRRIAKDHDITPKQLHKDFKSAHDGQIPDDWIKEQVEVEECGWMPLNEIVLRKNGMVYEVSMMYRGYAKRIKFFWPESKIPSRNDMQDAAQKFYPGSRLLAYYPVTGSDSLDDPLVVVPPMTENYVAYERNDWLMLNENDTNTLQKIYEEVGEPVSVPEIQEDGSLMVIVEDHDTGEHKEVVFGEGAAWTKSAGKNKAGGLNEKGRKSYERENPGSDLKAPTKEKGNPRRKSFCARMKGMRKRQKKSNNTGDDRLSKSLKAWDC